ncbi:DNA-binding protein WhiA [Streptococcus caprae]|uniref:Probable cell division protein WhiA n=1 Tax=Streptococcus caprae TaxID=1640501 RepID=A0ABV8CXQ7_9STRE
MSFSSSVKEEVLHQSRIDRSELSALMKMSGSLGLTGNGLTLTISTENAKVARHVYELLDSLYQVKPDISHHLKSNLKKNRVYAVAIEEDVEAILADMRLADSFFGIETGIEESILSEDEAGQSYLRGAFLATGSIRDPESGKYQLEIFSVYQDHAEDLAQLMHKFMLDAKVVEHKNGAVTYLQKAEDIMDFLLVIGALEAKTRFEEVKIKREARNDLNRANNAETANIARTVTASVRTLNNISKIMDTIGIDQLSGDLQTVAQLRIKHPDYSIQQIADLMDPPLTKSGVNHRLRKINKIADEL